MANPLLQHYIKLTEFLGQALGPDYEVALHDMTDKNRSIVAIANNHISGREIGAPLTNVALKILMDKSYETQDYRLHYCGPVSYTHLNKLFGDPAYLQARMSSACLIIIGIELIKMITSYTIDSVVDVMLLAIARQMIVEHTSPIENLIAVLSIGILFVIRKYLYISRLDRRRSKKEIEEDIRAEVLGVENRNEPKKPEPPEIGSLTVSYTHL